jgi:dTDP-glucose 4,6-dehydratase
MIFITGGAGFIGSNYILQWLNSKDEYLLNIDKLTYAGNLNNLSGIDDKSYKFIQCDIGDENVINQLLTKYKPRAIINFAAESHVDRSIANPEDFVKTNVVGTFNLLNSAHKYWKSLEDIKKNNFRFLHISTDEVYGSLKKDESPFKETNQYMPNSPYSASKASSDHFVRAFFHTYGLPTLTTNCSNNYGPFQFPEKLIPLCIHNAINNKPIPIYGDGKQIRDWLYVEDHCIAINKVLDKGRIGEVYNIGGNNEVQNIDVVNKICEILDEIKPKKDKSSYKDQITYIKDRQGHDKRYAIDSTKILNEITWKPAESFQSGIIKTINWYLENENWVNEITSGAYASWIENHYNTKK